MSTTTQTDMRWVAYGPAGVVGMIRHVGDEFRVAIPDRGEIGAYPTLEVAKGAVVSHQRPGSGRPEFRRV
ncbi:MAG TPA: methyltransferase [Microbacterium sp.]|nr:methyltransferase [Microbacterium sp.]